MVPPTPQKYNFLCRIARIRTSKNKCENDPDLYRPPLPNVKFHNFFSIEKLPLVLELIQNNKICLDILI